MNARVGFGPFVALDEHDAPRLLARMSSRQLGIDSEKYGIRSRLIARPAATVIDLAAAVIDKLCAVTGVERHDLGGIVLSSRQFEIERLAAQLAERLETGSEVRGIERACSGFPAATRLAVEMARRIGQQVAVVTPEIISRNINWEPPTGSPDDSARARGQASKLFADGAAAVLVDPRSSARYAILDCWDDEVPDEHQLLQKADVDGAADPWGRKLPGQTVCISMPGRRGYLLLKRAPELMVAAIGRSIENALESGQLAEPRLGDVIPHQANGLMVPRIEQLLGKKSWGVGAKVWNQIEHHGNTVSATIPLAMADAQSSLSPSALVAMPSVGAGGPGYRPEVLSIGCVLARVAG